ncbi:MAG TPA: hypothetical protein VIR31_06350, partial [Nitrososphaeraceae archaeon]
MNTEKLPYDHATYALMDGIDRSEKLAETKNSSMILGCKCNRQIFFGRAKGESQNALIRLQSYGVTD